MFGRFTTDHMLEIDWSVKDGWGKPKIVPYGAFKVPIAATSLHYGLSCIEGMNIIQNRENQESQSFRPEQHLN